MNSLRFEPSKWEACYTKEKNNLLYLLSNFNIGISHIGATAVAGSRSNRNVDILVVASSIADVSAITLKLRLNGYKFIEYMSNHECSVMVKEHKVNEFGITLRVVAYASNMYNRINAFQTYLHESIMRVRHYNDFREQLLKKYGNDWKSYYRHKKEYINSIIDENFKFE